MSYNADNILKLASNFVKMAESAKDAREAAKAKNKYYGYAGPIKGWLVGTEKELKDAGVNKIRHPNNDD